MLATRNASMRRTRRVKIGRIVRVGRSGKTVLVPFIRLSGKWLEQAGFQAGDYLSISVLLDGIKLHQKHTDTRF